MMHVPDPSKKRKLNGVTHHDINGESVDVEEVKETQLSAEPREEVNDMQPEVDTIREEIEQIQKEKFKPLIIGTKYTKGMNKLKLNQERIEAWDAGEDGDADLQEVIINYDDSNLYKMADEKNRIFKENEGFFITHKKQKDEYDIDYDKGKLKKFKKKKDQLRPLNNFQKTYEYYERRNNDRRTRAEKNR